VTTPTTVAFDDSALVRRCQAGDLRAFNLLISRHQDKVFNAVYRMVGNYEDARDLTQDAFVKALAGLDSFRGDAGFYTWVFRIAANAAISWRRRSGRVQTVDMTDDAEGAGAAITAKKALAAEGGAPSESAEQSEAAAEIQRALEKLDAEFRAALVLKDVEGLDYDQIAEILDVPMGTVKSRIHRARMEMRKLLSPMLGQ
jgi:RNA polymerase sigma-70 factor (ECF subfamily)